MFGVSIPPVTTKFARTKFDMRKGRNTGSPVSGCRVESTIFFAAHSSGVIEGIWPCLYDETSFFAFSRPAEDTKSVLRGN